MNVVLKVSRENKAHEVCQVFKALKVNQDCKVSRVNQDCKVSRVKLALKESRESKVFKASRGFEELSDLKAHLGQKVNLDEFLLFRLQFLTSRGLLAVR